MRMWQHNSGFSDVSSSKFRALGKLNSLMACDLKYGIGNQYASANPAYEHRMMFYSCFLYVAPLHFTRQAKIFRGILDHHFNSSSNPQHSSLTDPIIRTM